MRRLAVVALLVVAVGCGSDGSGSKRSEPKATARPGGLPGDTARFSVEDAGFVGTLVLPKGSGPWPAVVALGGSEGRQPTGLAEVLAGEGYASLALSYFGAPGLPDQLAEIPLEYFETALQWLRERPDVDSDHVVVAGASRGGEAALLIGATYPDLVQAVIATVPANVVTCGFPACDRSAWTLDGEPLPHVDDFDGDYYNTHPEAEIAVERIAGPVLLICGGQDLLSPSCPMSRAVIDRLDRNGHQFDHQLLEYPDAGHDLTGSPDRPAGTDQVSPPGGGTVDANNAARTDLWPKALAFLADATDGR
jgi:dienelactone hydrolase